jgi:preprotein translocase subunit SecA
LVDEADNVLIDDAGTPLIISAVPTQSQQCEADAYLFAATAAGHFVEREHYEYHEDQRAAELTPAGKRLARSLKQPETLRNWSWITLYEYLERAIRVRRDFHKDSHYVVRDGEIVIVDEFTGRLAEGRKWRAGIHQAVEAQEELEVTVDAGQSAQITVQDYFRRYAYVAGMTGTAASSTAELKKIYRVKVCVVPTNRPAIRQQLPTAIFADQQSKWAAVVDEVRQVHDVGRPVPIGTRSIDQSMLLSKLLTQAAIPHQVLNAHEIAAEAEIIARAGEQRSVTVSTNMAGRGTDIRLGTGVGDMGGLHVIATEMHEAARIDRQLIGRCGRQGDPGTYRQYLALDDELLKSGLGPPAAERLLRRYAGLPGELPPQLQRFFHRAQRLVEKRQFRQRKSLLHFEQQRRKIQREMGQDPYLDSLG